MSGVSTGEMEEVNGSPNQEFQEAKLSFRNSYGKANIAGINFGEIYADFE